MDTDEERPLVESENMPLIDSEKQLTGGKQESAHDGSGENSKEQEGGEEEQRTNEPEGDEEQQRKRDFQTIKIPGAGRAPLFSLRKMWAFTGPGFLMSIAYLDPGNIESDLQAGAVAEYQLLWVLLWSTVMGLILQLLSAKLGVVTGKHLAEVCHDEYPLVPRIFLWLAMELAIIGSDIQEVIGSAIAIHIISQRTIPLWEGCLITGVDTFTFLFLESYGLRYLEGFFGILITVMCGMFGWMYIYTKPDQLGVVKGVFIPWCQNCSQGAVEQGLGLVGAVIMPHNLYLHSGLVLSRAISRSNKVEVREGIKYNSIESTIALFISFIINLFVVCVFGAGVYAYSYDNAPYSVRKECTEDISLLNAADCLYYRYNMQAWVPYVWAFGLLAAGQSSTMTGTYAGQFVMEGFLGIRWARWKRVLLTRSVAMVPCVVIAIVAVNSLDYLDEYINVEQSMLLPFSLIPLLHATSSEKIMGDFKNPWWWSVIVWIIAVIIVTVNIYFIVIEVAIPGQWWRHLIASFGILIYFIIVMLFTFYPLLKWLWAKGYLHELKLPLLTKLTWKRSSDKSKSIN